MTNWYDVVRNRPEKYVGSTDDSGLHVLAYIVINNSIDEILAGHANFVEITIHNDNTITVLDDGRGIPVDLYPELPNSGVPALEVLLTSLRSRGISETLSTGMRDYDGIGIAVVNALSEWMRIEVYSAGSIHLQEYSRGEPNFPLKIAGVTQRCGTQISFKPDTRIFGGSKFSFDTLSDGLRTFSVVDSEGKIVLRDNRTNKQLRLG